MKTIRTLALLMGLFASIVFSSCQKNELVNPGSSEEVAAARIVLVTDPTSAALASCGSTCISPEGPYIQKIEEAEQTWGNASRPHWKKVNHVAYNTPTSFVVDVTFTHSGGNASDSIYVTAFGTTKKIPTLASGATSTFTFDLPAGWQACDEVAYSIKQKGQNSPMDLPYSYNLFAVCPEDKNCETSFTGEAISCGGQREAVFTFVSKDAQGYFKIQGGLTNFTGADAIVEVTGGTITSTDQWTPGGSTNRVIRVEGSAAECETITIRIKWASSNSGGIITGSWSVKDANGVEIASAVEGLTCNQ